MNRENNSEERIYGRNAVTEAIKSGMPINKVLISSGEISGSLKSIMALIKEKHIVYQVVDKNKLNDITGTKNHQGVALYTSPAEYCDAPRAAAPKGDQRRQSCPYRSVPVR